MFPCIDDNGGFEEIKPQADITLDSLQNTLVDLGLD